MQTVTTIGLDIAKSVFQVHGVDAAGQVVIRRKLKRRYVLAFFQKLPPCLVGIEACASAHYWARELRFVPIKTPEQQSGLVLPWPERGPFYAPHLRPVICASASRRLICEAGQGQARQYQQTRRSLSPQPVCGRRALGHPLCQGPRQQTSAMAHGIAGAGIRRSDTRRYCGS
jgi:hypothetical protein